MDLFYGTSRPPWFRSPSGLRVVKGVASEDVGWTMSTGRVGGEEGGGFFGRVGRSGLGERDRVFGRVGGNGNNGNILGTVIYSEG